MSSRTWVSCWVLAGVLGTSVLAAGDLVQPRQWVVTYFAAPTRIANVVVEGHVLITHNDRVPSGEPCTWVFRFDPESGPQEVLTRFACIPAMREAPEQFTTDIEREPECPYDVLTSFQFAGDTIIHGVPSPDE